MGGCEGKVTKGCLFEAVTPYKTGHCHSVFHTQCFSQSDPWYHSCLTVGYPWLSEDCPHGCTWDPTKHAGPQLSAHSTTGDYVEVLCDTNIGLQWYVCVIKKWRLATI